MPIIAAGKVGGRWQTGRYIHFPNQRRHSDFLVSLVRAFGIDIAKFGSDPSAGPISELGM